MQKKNFAKM